MEKTISLVRFDTLMLAAYGTELVNILTHPSLESFRDNEHIILFLEKHKRYSRSLATTRKSEEPLRKLDRNRDRAFLRLRHLVIAALYSSNEEDVRKAKLLMGIIKSCGNRINAKRDAQETSHIQLLMLRLSTESAANAIEELGLKNALDDFEHAQTLFYEASARDIHQRNAQKQATPTSIRKEFEAAIRETWRFVEGMAFIAPSEAWTRASQNIEAKNSEYRAKMKHQKTFRDKGKAKNANKEPQQVSGTDGEAIE
jgi:hypothetical protein